MSARTMRATDERARYARNRKSEILVSRLTKKLTKLSSTKNSELADGRSRSVQVAAPAYPLMLVAEREGSDSASEEEGEVRPQPGARPEPQLAFTASASLFAVQRSLHRTKHDLRNRLHSIAYDAKFVQAFAALFPTLPCLANLRQGAWYVDPALPSAGGNCCFKSSDGHSRQWMFNRRRLNLHVALAAAAHGGVVLVDSTRGGKRIPDAFSKTVPLWACVLNTAVGRWRRRHERPTAEPEPSVAPACGAGCPRSGGMCAPAQEWDEALHLAPNISPSEAAQINDRITGWATELEAESGGPSGAIAELARVLHKPLRAMWFGADGGVDAVPSGASYGVDVLPSLPFTPLICLTASETAHPKRGEFVYGQGAADDEEGWAGGWLTPQLWWRHRAALLQCTDGDACVEMASRLAVQHPDDGHLPQTAAATGAAVSAASSQQLSQQWSASAARGGASPWAEIVDGRGIPTGIAIGTPAAATAAAATAACHYRGTRPPQSGDGGSVEEDYQFAGILNCGGVLDDGSAVATATGDGVNSSSGGGEGTPRVLSECRTAPDAAQQAEAPLSPERLALGVPAGGKRAGSAKALSQALPRAIAFGQRVLQQPSAQTSTQRRRVILCYCDDGEERSLAVAVALLAGCFDATFHHLDSNRSGRGEQGTILGLTLRCHRDMQHQQAGEDTPRVPAPHELDFPQQQQPPPQPVEAGVAVAAMSKQLLRRLLALAAWARPAATTPERALLQTMNRFFLSQDSEVLVAAAAAGLPASAAAVGAARLHRVQQLVVAAQQPVATQ